MIHISTFSTGYEKTEIPNYQGVDSSGPLSLFIYVGNT